MKVSREQVAENRRKILEAASHLFRAKGFDAVTVADVMKAAGLPHGGFYGYFKSKDDLIAQALSHALFASMEGDIDLARFTKDYLSRQHCKNLAGGCATAGLGAETIRQSPEARAVMTEALRKMINQFSKSAPGATAAKRRRAAIGSWAAMVGALVLARMCNDEQLANEVLTQTRAWIGEMA